MFNVERNFSLYFIDFEGFYMENLKSWLFQQESYF